MMKRTRKRGLIFLALATAIVLAVAVLRGCSGCAGAGPVAKSVADRLLPAPQRTVWARCPAPGTYSDSYQDASGSSTNYVYDVEAATEDGRHITVTIILFGREASGEGWLEIDAKGTSGVHYQSIAEDEVPQVARAALGDG